MNKPLIEIDFEKIKFLPKSFDELNLKVNLLIESYELMNQNVKFLYDSLTDLRGSGGTQQVNQNIYGNSQNSNNTGNNIELDNIFNNENLDNLKKFLSTNQFDLPLPNTTNATPSTSNNGNNVDEKDIKLKDFVYDLKPTNENVKELWDEYQIGLNGHPSLKFIESTYGTSWRSTHPSTNMSFSRRLVIIKEIEKRAREYSIKQNGLIDTNIDEAFYNKVINELEHIRQVEGLTMSAFINKIKSEQLRNGQRRNRKRKLNHSQNSNNNNQVGNKRSNCNDEDDVDDDVEFQMRAIAEAAVTNDESSILAHQLESLARQHFNSSHHDPNIDNEEDELA